MASSFLYLEDGRAFAPRFAVMASMLDLVLQELKFIAGAEEFVKYLAHFVLLLYAGKSRLSKRKVSNIYW